MSDPKQQEERSYTFYRMVPGEGDEKVKQEFIVKESELSSDQTIALARDLWSYFVLMPGPVQDLFLQRVDAEIAAHARMMEVAKNAAGGKSPGGIIMPGHFGIKPGEG